MSIVSVTEFLGDVNSLSTGNGGSGGILVPLVKNLGFSNEEIEEGYIEKVDCSSDKLPEVEIMLLQALLLKGCLYGVKRDNYGSGGTSSVALYTYNPELIMKYSGKEPKLHLVNKDNLAGKVRTMRFDVEHFDWDMLDVKMTAPTVKTALAVDDLWVLTGDVLNIIKEIDRASQNGVVKLDLIEGDAEKVRYVSTTKNIIKTLDGVGVQETRGAENTLCPEIGTIRCTVATETLMPSQTSVNPMTNLVSWESLNDVKSQIPENAVSKESIRDYIKRVGIQDVMSSLQKEALKEDNSKLVDRYNNIIKVLAKANGVEDEKYLISEENPKGNERAVNSLIHSSTNGVYDQVMRKLPKSRQEIINKIASVCYEPKVADYDERSSRDLYDLLNTGIFIVTVATKKGYFANHIVTTNKDILKALYGDTYYHMMSAGERIRNANYEIKHGADIQEVISKYKLKNIDGEKYQFLNKELNSKNIDKLVEALDKATEIADSSKREQNEDIVYARNILSLGGKTDNMYVSININNICSIKRIYGSF